MKSRVPGIDVTLSSRLLGKIVPMYLIVTVAVVAGQLALQYREHSHAIDGELQMLSRTSARALAHAVWSEDEAQIDATVSALLQLPIVDRVLLVGLTGDVIHDGRVRHERLPLDEFVAHPASVTRSLSHWNDKQFVPVGTVQIHTSGASIVQRMWSTAAYAVTSAIVKAGLLIVLMRMLFRRELTRPLVNLARVASNIKPKEGVFEPLSVKEGRRDEIDVIAVAFNGLQYEVQSVVASLDQLNRSLENQIEDRTARLAQANAQLTHQQENLQRENEIRAERENDLKHANVKLAASLTQLKDMQESLVEAEKMAALGQLVSGVAHELNTPIGLGLTAASQIKRVAELMRVESASSTLTRAAFDQRVADVNELSSAVESSLGRAAELIRSFKQISVDQSVDDRRNIDLVEYLEDVVRTHGVVTRQQAVAVHFEATTSKLPMETYAGAWSQVVSNLIVNAVTHAWTPDHTYKELTIKVSLDDLTNDVVVVVADNGRGIPENILRRIFDPFFTTNRANGGSGLGLHIVYNLVARRIGGRITVRSRVGAGTEFMIKIPLIERPIHTIPAEFLIA